MKAVRIHQFGGPEVLVLEDLPIPVPGPGQVLIKVAVAGVNYSDPLHYGGQVPPDIPVPVLPATPGFEVAGVIEQLGPEVSTPAVGMRVAASLEDGGYAEYAQAPVPTVTPLPDDIDFATVTTLLIQGMTAYELVVKAAQVQAGERVLIAPAAGGVGSLAVHLAKIAGAQVIGLAGSQEKLDLLQSIGVDFAFDYTRPDWVQNVLQATAGQGVNVLLDSVGGETAMQGMLCVGKLGRILFFGLASNRPMPPLNLLLLNSKEQQIVGFGGPLNHPERIHEARQALIKYIQSKQLRPIIGQTFALEEAATAQRALLQRLTVGKMVLSVS
ncbi:MAG: NADPH:quinone oxidoreductase family protein [Ktedonobacteraceae bacterium]|nr:NADPH:quinone oxidoreductase family protein [Ktedonobacteraceae bacterium]